ncbi:MAG: hypothetical protein VCC01_12365 [Candidatus Hydrogenedentota bacterium]
MIDKCLDFYVPRYRRPLESFLRSAGGEVHPLGEADEGKARVSKGDDTVLSMFSHVDPVEMRDALGKAGIEVPEYRVISGEDDIAFYATLEPPFVLRCGNQNRFVQYGADTILPYQQLISTAGQKSMVLEHAVYGSGLWVLGFVVDGAFQLHGVVDLEWLSETFRFPMELHIPSSLSDRERDKLVTISEAVAETLGLSDGPVRIEYNYVESEECFQVIEVDCGWFSDALPVDLFALGNEGSYWENQIRLLNGEAVLAPDEADQAVSLRWLHSRSGIVEDVQHTDDVSETEGVMQLELCVEVGMTLRHVLDVESRDRLGYVVATGATSGEAREVSRKAVDRIYIQRKTIL